MQTILVTGGAGYIGSQTVKELIKQSFDVVVLDNLENGHRGAVDKQAKLEIADLADIDAIRGVFDKYKIEAVIDFAACLAVGESMEQPEKYLKNNVLNFINLLNVMKEKKCQYIIKSSTAAVYGNPTKESDIPWKEDFVDNYHPAESALLGGKWQGNQVIGQAFFDKFIQAYEKSIADQPDLSLSEEEKNKLQIPLSIYGLTKMLDEILLKKYDEMHGIKSISLRYFNVCGADPSGEMGEDRSKPATLMTMAIYQLLGKVPELKIFGRDYETPDGTAIRDYIHPSDLAVGHILAIKKLAGTNQSDVFNLGTGKGSSVLEVIFAVEKAAKKKVKIVDSPRRSGDPTISVADPGKAEKILNWKAKYSLGDMAKTAWKWHSSHPNGYEETKERKN